MIVHELKIEKNYLRRLANGKKKAEIRLNDRDYQVGDILKFCNTTRLAIPADPDYYLYFKITHIHSGLGMQPGFVCLSVTPFDGGPDFGKSNIAGE